MTILIIRAADFLALNAEMRALAASRPDIVVVDELPVATNTNESFTMQVRVHTNCPPLSVGRPKRRVAQWKNERQPWSKR